MGSMTLNVSPDPVATARGTDTNEIEWKAQSVMRYHGRLPDLARDVIQRRANNQATTMFVMPIPMLRRFRSSDGNHTSSVIPARWSAFQNRLPGRAKWWPAAAE